MSEMSACDYAMLNGGNGWNNWMNNPFMYLIFLRFFGGYGYGDGATQGALTRAELTDGLNNQTLQRDLTDVRDAVGNVGLMTKDVGSNISDKLCCGFNGVNNNISQNRFDIVSALSQNRYDLSAAISQNRFDIASAIAQNGFDSQKCCCETNRNIDAVRYENAKNTCAITSAIAEDGEKTRALMISQQIQDLRDSREEVQRQLQSANLTLANAAQTQNILGSIGRFVPYAGCSAGCGCGW